MKTRSHESVLSQVRTAIAPETDPARAMERTVAVLKQELPHYTWVGLYVLDGNELVLGPYLGKPSPHTRIPLGRGICGAAATKNATIVVDDVNADPRYLACSLETKSEIVVPIANGAEVLGEIDIDSDRHAAFGAADRTLLEEVAALLAPHLAALRTSTRGPGTRNATWPTPSP
jgi:GAF domain-containing protein